MVGSACPEVVQGQKPLHWSTVIKLVRDLGVKLAKDGISGREGELIGDSPPAVC